MGIFLWTMSIIWIKQGECNVLMVGSSSVFRYKRKVTILPAYEMAYIFLIQKMDNVEGKYWYGGSKPKLQTFRITIFMCMNNYICLLLTLKLLHSITLNVLNAFFNAFSKRNFTRIKKKKLENELHECQITFTDGLKLFWRVLSSGI